MNYYQNEKLIKLHQKSNFSAKDLSKLTNLKEEYIMSILNSETEIDQTTYYFIAKKCFCEKCLGKGWRFDARDCHDEECGSCNGTGLKKEVIQ